MTAQYVFEVELNKSGDDECFEKIYLVGDSLLRVSHMAEYYVYEHNGGMFEFVVDIGSIKKVKGIGRILNADFSDEDEEFDPQVILDFAKNMPDEDTLTFKHDFEGCDEIIRVPIGQWNFIACPRCSKLIFRREVKDVGGMIFYQYIDELHNKE